MIDSVGLVCAAAGGMTERLRDMRRSICYAFGLILMILLLCACGSDESNLPEDGSWVSGRYLRGKQSDLIVTGDWDVITMGVADEAISFEGLEDGDVIRVYIDCILETWPGQTTVYAVEKAEEGDIQDISPELLEELREMGWL